MFQLRGEKKPHLFCCFYLEFFWNLVSLIKTAITTCAIMKIENNPFMIALENLWNRKIKILWDICRKLAN